MHTARLLKFIIPLSVLITAAVLHPLRSGGGSSGSGLPGVRAPFISVGQRSSPPQLAHLGSPSPSSTGGFGSPPYKLYFQEIGDSKGHALFGLGPGEIRVGGERRVVIICAWVTTTPARVPR